MDAPAVALQARQLAVHLGARAVLSDLNLTVAAAQWTCVVGPNGAGKSTLLKALAGLLKVQGQVSWHGQNLATIDRRQRARSLAWFGQSESALQDMQVQDVVMLGRLPHLGWLQAPGPADHAAVQWAMQALQVGAWRERALGALSAGERQRVLLARALATQAPMLLMDEPLNNLDPSHQVDWLELVTQLRAQGTTVLTVLHEIGMALHADQLLVLQAGRLVHQGPARDARTHRALEAVFENRIRVLSVDDQWVVLPRTRT